MKNKKLFGLGICALALGAVAGVVSTRGAVEAKAADLEYVKIRIHTGGAGDFADYTMTDAGTGAAGSSTASYTYQAEVSDGGWFTVYYKWSDGSDTWCDNKYFVPSEVDGGWVYDNESHNANYSGSTKTFLITAINPHENWVDIKIAEVVAPAVSSSSEAPAASSDSAAPVVNNQTFYFTNNKGWDNLHVYAWKGGSNNGWPGAEVGAKIAVTGYGQDLHSFVIDVNAYDHIILNENGDTDGKKRTTEIDLTDLPAGHNSFYIDGDAAVEGKWAVGTYAITGGADQIAVENFIGLYIHNQRYEDYEKTSEGDRAAKCAEKYNAAKEGFKVLTKDQKDLLAANYEEDYAAYLLWEAEVNKPSAYNIEGLKTTDMTWVITASLMAASALAVAGFIFIAKKKKQN